MIDLQLVLASSSPRRRELLSRLTSDFLIEQADIDETPKPAEEPSRYVTRLAEEKARALAAPGRVVIGADTAVVLDNTILGKPTDEADGAEMLRRLSGRAHQAITGVAVVAQRGSSSPECHVGLASTTVNMLPLSEATIAWYIATGEGADKAGGYGLQGRGAVFADEVEGSVTNVVGLPLPLLRDLLDAVGVSL